MEPLGAVRVTIRVVDANLPTVLDQLAGLGNGYVRADVYRLRSFTVLNSACKCCHLLALGNTLSRRRGRHHKETRR